LRDRAEAFRNAAAPALTEVTAGHNYTSRMDWKKRRGWVRASLLLRQNGTALCILAAWFLGNLAVFSALSGFRTALAATFFFRIDPGGWGTFYHSLSGFVVFGVTVNVVVTDLYRRYRPEDTCRLLAGAARDHIVVIGYTNLGRRVCELLWQEGRSVVVIDDRRTEVAG